MEFTNEEKSRINLLYGNDFKDIEPSDAELIARWEQFKAQSSAEFKAKQDALNAKTAAEISEAKAVAEKAMEGLESLKDAALARLERIDEQTKSK